MSRIVSHLNSAKQVIEQYKGELPLGVFLKNFFSLDKKYGSKDRKSISSLCYFYFRLGPVTEVQNVEERILLGVFLCEKTPHPLLETLRPQWNEKMTMPLQKKLAEVPAFLTDHIFPWGNYLSDGMEPYAFSLSFLIQPKLFIRVRPGRNQIVSDKLQHAKVAYEVVAESCLAFENGTRLEDVLIIHTDYVVQDYNSQRVGEFMQVIQQPGFNIWDCCAASGGKSIMAFDINPHIKLTVSDIRPAILQNLHQRFSAAAIENYRPFIADLYYEKQLESALANERFDMVICDAPCTGSGTWGRTPEQLYFFNHAQIERYSNQQKKIVKNVCRYLKPNGYLLYITCSVFKSENEEVAEYIQQQLSLSLLKAGVLKGYSLQADTLFVALFQCIEAGKKIY